MVPLCYMLCLYVYGLLQYGQLNNNCHLCFLLCSVLLFKIEKGEKRCCCCFRLGWLNDHLFGKELFIRFSVCVFRVHLSNIVLLSLQILRVGCGM